MNLALTFNAAGYAQPELDLWRTYDAGGAQVEYFQDIYPREDGGYYLCGTTSSRGWIVRLDDEGEVVWSRTYNFTIFNSVIEADNGDLVLAGVENNSIAAARIDSENGDVIWEHQYGDGRGHALIELKEGDFILTGYFIVDQSWKFGAVIRLRDNGEQVWLGSFGDVRWNELYSLRETENGIVAVGRQKDGNENFTHGWAIKVGFNGDQIWSRVYVNRWRPNSELHKEFDAIVSCPEGFAVAGYHDLMEQGNTAKFCLTILDADGSLVSEHVYPLQEGTRYRPTGISKLNDGGYCIVGAMFWWDRIDNYHSLAAIRVRRDYQLEWVKDFHEELNGIALTPYWTALNSIITIDGNVLIASGGVNTDDEQRGLDGLLVRLEPDYLGPTIFYKDPEDSLQNVLRGDRIDFVVRARTREGLECRYQWSYGDSVLGRDTLQTVAFDTLQGDYPITCRVTAQDWAVETGWMISVRDLFIASSSPDTLALSLRRGTSQTFSLDTVRAVEGDPVEYQWTLTNLDNFEREDAGSETSATVEFLRSGNYQMEGLAYRGESSDNVIWTVAVRGAVLDFWPRRLRLSVPPDSLVNFGVLPFNPESDSLSYAWYLDGELIGQDSAVGWYFAPLDSQAGRSTYAVNAIVMDGAEGDTVTWEVTVQDPAQVGKWSSGQVNKWGILSVSPNPFNNYTTIRFSVPSGMISAQSAKSAVRLTLHDLTGREIQRLVNDWFVPGGHSLSLNGSNLPPGLYFLRLRIAERQSTQKLVLIK